MVHTCVAYSFLPSILKFLLIALSFVATSASAVPLFNFVVPNNAGNAGVDGRVLVYNSLSGNFKAENFDSNGTGQIQGMTLGPDGRVYASLFESDVNTNGQVVRINPFTGESETFVEAGSGGLFSPTGLTFGPDGHLYVANNLGNVLRYDGSTGDFIDSFATGLLVPQDVVFGPDGNLYVSNGFGDSVSRFDGATGALIDHFAPTGTAGLASPVGMAFGPNGDLYVTSFPGSSVFRFDGTTGGFVSELLSLGGITTPLDLAFGPDANLYVYGRGDLAGPTNSVERIDPTTGSSLGTFATLPSGFNTGMFFFDPRCLRYNFGGQGNGCFPDRSAIRVPEPSPLALLGAGLLALVALRR